MTEIIIIPDKLPGFHRPKEYQEIINKKHLPVSAETPAKEMTDAEYYGYTVHKGKAYCLRCGNPVSGLSHFHYAFCPGYFEDDY